MSRRSKRDGAVPGEEPTVISLLHLPFSTAEVLTQTADVKAPAAYVEVSQDDRKRWQIAAVHFRAANPSLLWEKFRPVARPELPREIERATRDMDTKLLKMFATRWNDWARNSKDIAEARTRSKTLADSLRAAGYGVKEIQVKSVWRMVVGLGAATVWDTGFLLHRMLGYPYLPGSSLKGVARAWALRLVQNRMAEHLTKGQEAPGLNDLEDYLFADDREERSKVWGRIARSLEEKQKASARGSLDEDGPRLLAVFGNQGWRGKVAFLDAVPGHGARLEVDVITLHHPWYYGIGERRLNEPIPVPFLTIAPKTPFECVLASRNATSLEDAARWLSEGLRNLGVGGKTSSGYGWMA